MGNIMERAQFADLLDPAFRKIYTDATKELPYKYDTIFNVYSSNKNLEKDSSISGLGQLAEVGEGEAVTSDSVIQGYDVTYTHKKFGRKTTITEEMVDDDQSRQIDGRAKGLAIALNRSVETSGADVFNYGWTAGGGGNAAFTSGGDGKALFATDHPRTDGGTAQGNSTTADFAEDSLDNALLSMRATLDDRGQLMLVQPDTLVTAPALEKEANIVLNSTQRAGTANNDVNPFKGALNTVVWDFLGAAAGGSDTAWFIVDSKSHKLNWFWRKREALERNVDFDTSNIEYKLTARWSNGYADWRGVYGSKGDNS